MVNASRDTGTVTTARSVEKIFNYSERAVVLRPEPAGGAGCRRPADARPIRHATPQQLRARSFPAGSMGPKVEAACRFVEATGRMAAIGRLDAAEALLHRTAGTIVSP
jgi:carbamate kinase